MRQTAAKLPELKLGPTYYYVLRTSVLPELKLGPTYVSLRNGKVVRFREYSDSAQIVRAYRSVEISA